MLRLHATSLNSDWSDFLLALFKDLEPLGHFARLEDDGALTIGTTVPLDRGASRYEDRWSRAHHKRHQDFLRQRRDEILSFERDFADLFVDMSTFQPSSVLPRLEIVDFDRPEHVRIIDYLKLYQSVTSGKAVGRRMGLLIWDVGQSGRPRLFGGALLASARFSQRMRDLRFGWEPDYPKTSEHHNPGARQIRVDGLARIMQLSVACALPPYSLLSGAWLAAMSPFTPLALTAFRQSLKITDRNADLAAVVTTTGMAVSGAPFRGHRVGQLAPKGVKAAPGAEGNLYSRARPTLDAPPLRASFLDLLSDDVLSRALKLFELERPDQFARLKSPQRAAIAYALRRLGLHRSLFDGNEMGVHIGVLGADTLDYLKSGKPRPAHARWMLDWEQVVDVWSRRFLPAPSPVGESATEATKQMHREGRQRRLAAAKDYPEDRIKLSGLIDRTDPTDLVRVADLAPIKAVKPPAPSFTDFELPSEQVTTDSDGENSSDTQTG
ncbi:hypothetical protein ACCS70_18910 [Rhizobium ruizarguesonis]